MATPTAAQWLAVGAGAALGAWGRWALSLWLNPLWPGFALGTLAANVLGGLAIGAALVVFASGHHEGWRLFAVTGLLGGFTTFSAFSAESLGLLQRQQWALAALHTLAHVLLALLAAAAGHALARAALR